jgi:DNA-binding NarL/FixJ family response regulator
MATETSPSAEPSSAQRTAPVQVLCVDDNDWVGESIQRVLRRRADLAFAGWLPGPDGLMDQLRDRHGAVVLLDVDIPGTDSFDLVQALGRHRPDVKVVMLSGHLRLDIVDRALAAGAWGYLSKNDDVHSLVAALERVVAGEIGLSPAVVEEYRRR